VALCLEAYDLWILKAVAGRPKDLGFCRALLDRKAVDGDVLAKRLTATSNIDPTKRDWIKRLIRGPARASGA